MVDRAMGSGLQHEFSAMEMMIEAEGLTKHFGDVEALAGLDLAVPSGQGARHPRARTARARPR